MKYPQLVSSRAVYEISDWLIKRLEDLDIEHPGVYSRFLLSLLHTPFKVNAIDLLEIPQLKDLKQPYHLLNKNNEELKRLAAVESLMEVSAEENKSNIISLVDELHLKLRKIESSSNYTDDRANIISSSSPSSASANSKFYKNLKKIKRNHGAENPTKNYYLAFPALSGKKSSTMTSDGCKLSSSGNDNDMKKDSDLMSWSSLMSNSKGKSLVSVDDADKYSGKMKTPTKRRHGKNTKRNFYKTDVQLTTVTKNYGSYDADGATFSPKKMQMVKNVPKKRQRNQIVTSKNPKNCVNRGNNFTEDLSLNAPKMSYPSGSATIWDMDFKGHWEMDRDLIGEFIEKQNNDKYCPAEKPIAADNDEKMLMKCLPMKLIDDSLIDDHAGNLMNIKEAQSINSFKLKFDANIKALWSDVDDSSSIDPQPLTYKAYDEDNASLASSFAGEKNSLSLFNFDGQRHHHQLEVNAPANQHQFYGNSNTDFMKILDYDCNNNTKNGSRGTIYRSQQSVVSPGSEKYIKSGTNLQTSIWSDGEFASEPESLIYKDVVDHKPNPNVDGDDGIYKKMKSIGDEMKYWQKSIAQDVNDKAVSLFNHSDTSGFKRFRPLIVDTTIRANYHPLNQQPKAIEPKMPTEEATEGTENLLTAERTHFSPIMRDGHTFVIDDTWEEVKWERSPGGGWICNNKRYMKWNNDSKKVNDDIDLDAMEEEAADFTIKFMLVENDKACQTDPNDFVVAHSRSLLEINEEYCKRKIYDEYFKGIGDTNKWRYFGGQQQEDSNDYSFFSVNRVKDNSANAAKTLQDILMSSNSSSSSICTITSSYEASAVDPFESWRSIKIENSGGMMDSDYKQACMHSLWEQCKTCTRNDYDPYEEKSIPANRLMKDELRMDGDEIMNVIQNLYITGDYCDSEEEEKDDEEFDMNHVYMDMLDDSMDGSAEEESKFYEADGKTNVKIHPNKKIYTPSMFDHHQREDLLQLENFDEITLAKMNWQWDKNQCKIDKDQEKYLKLLKWIQASLIKDNHPDNNNNNNYQLSNEDRRSNNRKRRHSTCQNFMDSLRSQDHDIFYSFNPHLRLSPTRTFIEENSNLFIDAAKMLKVNIEKILLISNPSNGNDINQLERCKDGDGANYYRNILQQQHALIKQMDLARPLTR